MLANPLGVLAFAVVLYSFFSSRIYGTLASGSAAYTNSLASFRSGGNLPCQVLWGGVRGVPTQGADEDLVYSMIPRDTPENSTSICIPSSLSSYALAHSSSLFEAAHKTVVWRFWLSPRLQLPTLMPPQPSLLTRPTLFFGGLLLVLLTLTLLSR